MIIKSELVASSNKIQNVLKFVIFNNFSLGVLVRVVMYEIILTG